MKIQVHVKCILINSTICPMIIVKHITVAFYSPKEFTFLQIFQMVLTVPASTSAKPPNGGSITMTNFSLATNDSNVFSFASTPKKKWLNILYQQKAEDEKNWPYAKTKITIITNFVLTIWLSLKFNEWAFWQTFWQRI